LPPTLDLPSAKAANTIRQTRTLRRKSGKRVGGQVGHRGATLHQVEFPDRLRVHAPQRCRGCQSSLIKCSVVGYSRRQVFDLPLTVLEVTDKGVCVRDGWFSYDKYRQATHALCNVHLLHELIYVEEVSAEQQWTRPLAKLLLDIKAAVERAKARGETKLGDEQRARFTARYERLVKRAAHLNPPPKAEKPDPLSKRYKVVKVKRRDPASPLIYRLDTKRDQVLRFMTDLRVPFDNNATERDIRMVKLQQKIGGCFRTPQGAEAFCRIRSYLSSARKQGHSPLIALERAFAGKPLALKG
jgi:hypothetical protein